MTAAATRLDRNLLAAIDADDVAGEPVQALVRGQGENWGRGKALGYTPDVGLFAHHVQVFTPPGEPIDGVEAWVDTGSTYTWLPRALIERARVGELEQREFILANGQRERREVAQVRISLGGPQFFTYCAMAEPGEELLLGAVALEEAGLAVDPVNRRLVPTAGYALTALSFS